MDDTVETGFEEVRPLKGFRKRWATSSVADDFSVGDAEQVYVENLMGDPSSCGHDSLSGWDVLPMTAPICAEETVGEQNEPFDMHDSAPCVEVEDPFGGESAWKQRAMTAHSKRQRLAREKLPWELPGMSTVFRTGDCWSGTIIAGVKDMFLPSGIGISEVLNSTTVQRSSTAVASDQGDPPVIRLNVKRVRKELPDEDIRRMALCKLLTRVIHLSYA